MPSCNQSYDYVIDHEYRIVEISSEFVRFAQDNKAAKLTEQSLIGSCLFDHFDQAEVIELYKSLIDKVIETQQEVVVPFRCDAPEKRRFMRLRIQPESHGRIRFFGVEDRIEPRESVSLLDLESTRNDEFVVVCSWCKKVRDDDDWVEIEDGFTDEQLYNSKGIPKISHGICTDCKNYMMKQISA